MVLLLLVLAGSGPASAARIQDHAAGSSADQAFLLKLDPASTVRVYLATREDGPRAARAAAFDQRTEIGQAQSEVIDALPSDAQVIYRTHSLMAAVGVTAHPDEKSRLEEIPGVRAVFPIAPKTASNATAVPLQKAPDAWTATNQLGDDMTIAVIDTGVDYTHSDFGGLGTTGAYDAAHDNETEVPESGFPNAKVIGGVDLVGDSYNDDRESPGYQPDPQPDQNPIDCDGHGTHVAGSAAGYGVKSDGSTYDGVYNDSTDFAAMNIGPGMAPKAKVYAIKVFGCEGSTNVVAQAIDRAVDPNQDGNPSDHADVINLSLGSEFGSVVDGDAVAANAAVAMGVSVVASAGNSGDHTDIGGGPGNASRAITVASTEDAGSRVDGAKVTIDGNQSTFPITRAIRYDWTAGPDLSGDVVAAPPENETACSPYPLNTFTDKVVLVRWHDAAPECPSTTRSENLAAAGAVGYIFGSDAESFRANIGGSDVIPGVLMAASGANAIRAGLDASHVVTADETVVNAVLQNFPDDVDKVSSFSSRGSHAAGNVKPDVAAVGGSVFSAAVGSGSEGTSKSGTSMAAPMVAGLAALVRQANPDWTPLQVKADIMNTASHDVFVNGSAIPAGDRYGPPRVGAGRIDAVAATSNKVLAYDPAGGAVSLSFGPVAVTGPMTMTRELTVDNQSDSEAEYTLTYDPINEVPGAEFTVSPASLTVGPDQTATATVSLVISDPSALTKAVDPTIGRLARPGVPRETLAEAFGRVLVASDDPGATLRVPVYAAPRPASEMSQPEALRIHRDAATAGQPEQIATFELSGSGVGVADGQNGVGDSDPDNDIRSLAAGFELQAESGEAPECGGEISVGCWRLPDERNADIRLVGFTSDANLVADPDDARGYFAIAVQAPWNIPANRQSIQIVIDADSDGKPDLVLRNSRLGRDDAFVAKLVKPDGQLIDEQGLNGRMGDTDTAVYDSDVMVLPVLLKELADYGINPDNPRITYGIETYSAYSEKPIDQLGYDAEAEVLVDPLSVDLYEPGLTVTGESGEGPLVLDQPGKSLTVTRNVASYEADAGQGLMMVHFQNPVGAKAQKVSLLGAATTTDLFLAPGTLTARVEPEAEGLPEPDGQVRFTVDGRVVGESALTDGLAVLERNLRHGGTRHVTARYMGNSDFDSSSAEVERHDPLLTGRVATRGKNRFGWYRRPVTVVFRCQTRGSGLTEDCPYPRRLSRDGRGQQVTRAIVAFNGGRATVTVRGISIDRTAPVVRIRGPRRGATYSSIRRARCAGRDRTSGILSCRISHRRRGQRLIYKAVALDRAGNRSVTRTWVRLGG